MNINISKKKPSILISDEKKISIALMASFVILTIQYFFLIYFNLLGTSSAFLVQSISKILVGIFFLIALPAVIRRSKLPFIVLYFTAIFLFLVYFLFFPENRGFILGILFPFFFTCLPAFIYVLSIRDWNVFRKVMKTSSLIIFAFGFILSIMIFSGKASIGAYSMSLSYYLLLPAVIFLDSLFNKFSLRDLFLSLISLMIILSLGSRGAILCVVVFILLKFIRFNFTKSYTRLVFYLTSITILIITIFSLEKILMYIDNVLLGYGIKSRSIQLFLNEDIYLSGRDNIYDSLLEALYERPLLGVGLAGDRNYTETGYAHNIFLEILSNFGVFFGSLIMLILILLVLFSLLIKDQEKFSIVSIWMSLGFVHLMVSSSYLIDMKFWVFLGVIVTLLYRNKTSSTRLSV